MVGVYKHLVELHKQGSLDLSRVVTFNLDEYLGLPATHSQSFIILCGSISFRTSTWIRGIFIFRTELSRAITINIALRMKRTSERPGGIDLQILGIGRNGHIGFNEPTSSLASRTRLKVLSQETMDDNAKSFAPGEERPRCAITMGIGTILEARKIILLATGAAKAAAVAKSIEGPIASAVSASALQLHPEVTFIVDEQAASQLTQRNITGEFLEMTALLTPDRLS